MLQIKLPLQGNFINESLLADHVENTNITFNTDSKFKYCAHFNGNGTISVPIHITDITNTSLCMWAKSNVNLNVGGISYNAGVNITCFSIFNWSWQFSDGSTWYYIPTNLPRDNTWHHICCTLDNNTIRTYLDGKQIQSQKFPTGFLTILDSNHKLTIGADLPGGVEYYTGDLVDVRLYSHCLSEIEIKNMFNKRYNIFYKNGNVFYTNLNESLLSNMETKTLSDNSKWIKIFEHNSGNTVLFKDDNEARNCDMKDKFSKLYLLEYFRNKNNKFEFMLCYPDKTTEYNRWLQSNNPCTEYISYTSTSTGSIVPGYEPVHIAWNSNYWGGLTRNHAYNETGPTYIDGSVGHGNWYYSIGSQRIWGSPAGVPVNDQLMDSNAGITTRVQLWVRIDTIKNEINENVNITIENLNCYDLIEY